jgi:prepilin-type N-terminal cleavage/methylation domain-containing protein
MAGDRNYYGGFFMNVRRGFTLIELLVVIAIIAILAAILFPVFAQAKQAAKGAASLSNSKQIGLAVFMYEGDADDRSPMSMSWQPDAPVFFGGCGVVSWAQACAPYMKNGDMLQDPLATAETVPAGWPPAVYQSILPEYGFVHTVWSPMLPGNGAGSCADPWRTSPQATTSVGRPADVPLIVSKPNSREQNAPGASWWYGAGTLLSCLITDPPDCTNDPARCFGGWGSVGNWPTLILAGQSAEVGRYTGGNARRRALNHVVMFGDGHASAQKAGKMAIGTNFIDTTSAPQPTITNANTYRWNRQ